MFRFLVSLLVFAVAGSAAVWFGVPALKSAAPRAYARTASALLGRPVAVPGEEGVRFEPVAGAPDLGGLFEKADRAIDAGLAKAASTETGAKALSAARSGASAVASAAETIAAGARELAGDAPGETASASPEPSSAEVPATEAAPEPDPRAAQNADPGLPWGVVATNSFCYDETLHRIGKLPGGTVVEHGRVRRNGVDEWVECAVLHRLVWQERRVWFRADDLLRFEGATYAECAPAVRDAMIDYCAAWGRYEEKRAEQTALFLPKNPHGDAYEKAKAEHDALQKEIDETVRKIRWSDRNDLPGGPAERQALLKRANELRVEQKAEAARFNPIRDRWQAWEDAHPAGDVSVPENAAMREARAEMERLRPAVEAVVPDLEPVPGP